MEILIGLTSTKKNLIPTYINEIRELKITKIALFPTCLDKNEREALYRELEKTSIEEIPHVHLRTDMYDEELDYLTNRFQTQVFNIHSKHSTHPYYPQSDRFKKRIFLENSGLIPHEDELSEYGGLCVDFSHWQDAILSGNTEYAHFEKLVRRFPPGCCHVSGIRTYGPKSTWGGYDFHSFEKIEDLDYIIGLAQYLPSLVSLELENTPQEQLLVKNRLEKLLKKSIL